MEDIHEPALRYMLFRSAIVVHVELREEINGRIETWRQFRSIRLSFEYC
jgi:hypothetical protein